jgi:hypothetical protein
MASRNGPRSRIRFKCKGVKLTNVFVHRVNSINQLKSTPPALGVEIDIRSDLDGLYLSHDPFISGPRFEEWLKYFSHRSIILNMKEDGLEHACQDLMSKSNVSNFFFLDQALPTIVARGRLGLRNMSCRFSEFEPREGVRALADFCDWVWVDFYGFKEIDIEVVKEFKDFGLKVCAVSPELHSGNNFDSAHNFALQMKKLENPLDAVCTKFPELWAHK